MRKIAWAALWIMVLLTMSMWGCAALERTYSAWPIKEYEILLYGRPDADYVGTKTCTAKCHAHDKLTRDFSISIHGRQVAKNTGLPLVDCESCHGPGSLAIENIVEGTCDFSTLIPLNKIPAGAQALLCLRCHRGQSLENLGGWPNSEHAEAGLSCMNCHSLHKGPGQRVHESEIVELCLSCHPKQRALLKLPSHHPLLESKMTCLNCHNPHGTTYEYDLRRDSIRDLCTSCHGNLRGPFVLEHGGEVYDDCRICHNPHGTINPTLLTYSTPFLCLRCHNGHQTMSHPGLATVDTRKVWFTDCTRCHATHHGSELPGPRNKGRYHR